MDASVRRADRVVVQVGESLGERDDADIVTFTDAQAADLATLLAQPNGGVVLNADGTLTALPAPTPPTPPPDPDDELAQAIAAATTLNELKAALLGHTTAAAVKGRPTA